MIDLSQAQVSDDIWRAHPSYAALLVTARGVRGGPSDAESESALSAAEHAAREALDGGGLDGIPAVVAWRDAFRQFGVRPRSAVSSLESLLRRAGEGLPRIDRLTDHYNAISIRHQIPFGGEDLDAYAGSPRLVIADGTEAFDAVEGGQVVANAPKPGEVVWRDDAGVTCRRWNWRQCARTRITPHTKNVLFVLDGLGTEATEAVLAAGTELVAVLRRDTPGVEVATRLLTPPR